MKQKKMARETWAAASPKVPVLPGRGRRALGEGAPLIQSMVPSVCVRNQANQISAGPHESRAITAACAASEGTCGESRRDAPLWIPRRLAFCGAAQTLR